MPRFRVCLEVSLEVECQDEGIAIDTALRLHPPGGQVYASTDVSTTPPTVSVSSVETLDTELRLPQGVYLVGGVLVYTWAGVRLANESDRWAEVYPNAQNGGRTWGLNLRRGGGYSDDGGRFQGAHFGLLDALGRAWRHVRGVDDSAKLPDFTEVLAVVGGSSDGH